MDNPNVDKLKITQDVSNDNATSIIQKEVDIILNNLDAWNDGNGGSG